MDDNLYFDSSINNNSTATTNEDAAIESNVKENYAFRNIDTNDLMVGTMPINQPQAIGIDPKSDAYPNNNSYTIPEGYHYGTGVVSVRSLEEYTYGNATPESIEQNKVCWVNGKRCVGALDISGLDQPGTATNSDIITGKTAWVNKKKILGILPLNSKQDQTLLAGESYTIPYGVAPGTSVVSAASLSSQTEGTATQDKLFLGESAWVNGEKIVGTFDLDAYIKEHFAITDATKSDVLFGKKFYSVSYEDTVEGTMPNHSGEGTRIIAIDSTFTIPEGYYNGLSAITTQTLRDATVADAIPDLLLNERTAWVNGEKIVGTMPYNDEKITELDPGEIYTIPKGYHHGTGTIVAPSFDAPGTATPPDIVEEKTAWINGHKITGTMPVQSKQKVRIEAGNTVYLAAGYYPNGITVYGIYSAPELDLTGTDAYVQELTNSLEANGAGTVDETTESFVVEE